MVCRILVFIIKLSSLQKRWEIGNHGRTIKGSFALVDKDWDIMLFAHGAGSSGGGRVSEPSGRGGVR